MFKATVTKLLREAFRKSAFRKNLRHPMDNASSFEILDGLREEFYLTPSYSPNYIKLQEAINIGLDKLFKDNDLPLAASQIFIMFNNETKKPESPLHISGAKRMFQNALLMALLPRIREMGGVTDHVYLNLVRRPLELLVKERDENSENFQNLLFAANASGVSTAGVDELSYYYGQVRDKINKFENPPSATVHVLDFSRRN